MFCMFSAFTGNSFRWRRNGRDSVSNHQPRDCLLNLLFRRWSKKTSKLRVTGLCAWNSPVSAEFPSQRASNTENAWSSCEGCVWGWGFLVWINHADVGVLAPLHCRPLLLVEEHVRLIVVKSIMTSPNGNIFRVAGPLWGEFSTHWWIPLTKASDAELWCFLCSAPEQTVE